MERRHLERVEIVAVLLSVYIHINRLAFDVAAGLVLLAALGQSASHREKTKTPSG